MAEFKGAVLARLDAMDFERRIAREESSKLLNGLQEDMIDIKLKIAYHRGQAAALGLGAGTIVSFLVPWFKEHFK